MQGGGGAGHGTAAASSSAAVSAAAGAAPESQRQPSDGQDTGQTRSQRPHHPSIADVPWPPFAAPTLTRRAIATRSDLLRLRLADFREQGQHEEAE